MEKSDVHQLHINVFQVTIEVNTRGKTNLGKESIKTMNFLPFFNKSIKLSNSLKCKFIHKVYNIRFRKIFVLEFLDGHRECC
jgi:hypothetical protein